MASLTVPASQLAAGANLSSAGTIRNSSANFPSSARSAAPQRRSTIVRAIAEPPVKRLTIEEAEALAVAGKAPEAPAVPPTPKSPPGTPVVQQLVRYDANFKYSMTSLTCSV